MPTISMSSVAIVAGDLRSFLTTNSVGTLIHYSVPAHLQPAYQGLVLPDRAGLLETETICRRVLGLMHPRPTDAEMKEIGNLIARWSGQLADRR